MEVVLISTVFIVLMALRIPIGTALGVAEGWSRSTQFDLGIEMLGVNFASGIASFPLLAIPFFVLAGVILDRAGLAATHCPLLRTAGGAKHGRTGHGGGHDLHLLGIIVRLRPGHHRRRGHDPTGAHDPARLCQELCRRHHRQCRRPFDHPAAQHRLHYLWQHHQRVGQCPFRGRYRPRPDYRHGDGAAVAYLVSRQRGYRGVDQRGSATEIWQAFKKSIWALLAPVVILGGIYSGIFTPTEAAVVAVFYSLAVAVLVYHSIGWRDLIDMLVDAAVTSSVIMFIVVFAGIFTWTASVIGVIDRAAELIVSIAPNAVVMIILVDLLLLALGMVLDAISISYLLMPILIPVLQAFGIDPLWYGVIFISALAVGQATPPVGVNLFTAANLIGSDVDSVAKEAIPYVLMDVVVLIILSLLPVLSLYLPIKAGLYAPLTTIKFETPPYMEKQNAQNLQCPDNNPQRNPQPHSRIFVAHQSPSRAVGRSKSILNSTSDPWIRASSPFPITFIAPPKSCSSFCPVRPPCGHRRDSKRFRTETLSSSRKGRRVLTSSTTTVTPLVSIWISGRPSASMSANTPIRAN